MCRHLAYVGPPTRPGSLLIDPPHSLVRQSWAPRRQTHGVVNADGCGLGWWAEGHPVPARHRGGGPVWADETFEELCRVVSTRAFLAAVRSATAGMPTGAGAAAPLRATVAGTAWLFSHNGAVADWAATGPGLLAHVPPEALAGLGSTVDSAVLWALVGARMATGTDPGTALAEVVALTDTVAGGPGRGGRLTFLLTDGNRILATCRGASLCWRVLGHAVVVASEPYDDEPGWHDVPDHHLLRAEPGTGGTAPRVLVEPLPGSAAVGRATTTTTPPIAGPERTSSMTAPAYRFTDHLPADFAAQALRDDARTGLTARSKWLPPKWFYDKVGSELFEEITRLPEYYPFAAEREILRQRAAEIVGVSGCTSLVELGSGSSEKTELLLQVLDRPGASYTALDVSADALHAAAERVAQRHPALAVHAVRADFEHQMHVLPDGTHRLVAFLGSTLGNFPPAPRQAFLGALRDRLTGTDRLLLGLDLVKSPDVLVPAYDDSRGVSAAFNRNVLEVLNTGLDADFDTDRFDHVALWNAEERWMEMRLRSRGAQRVHLAVLDLTVDFSDGEDLHTEISAKFERSRAEAELGRAGFGPAGWWTDEQGRFALSLWAPV